MFYCNSRLLIFEIFDCIVVVGLLFLPTFIGVPSMIGEL